jgi:hypothetical protein
VGISIEAEVLDHAERRAAGGLRLCELGGAELRGLDAAHRHRHRQVPIAVIPPQDRQSLAGERVGPCPLACRVGHLGEVEQRAGHERVSLPQPPAPDLE